MALGDFVSDIDSTLAARFIASPNYDERADATVDILVLHYTGMPDAEGALARLCDPQAKVSSHYFVYENGEIVQLVSEARRAWHAGVSRWHHWTDINSRSIGIEIANPGHDGGCPPFPLPQIEAVIALGRDIAGRWPIPPEQVLAHSDIAPSRKQDPGEIFPWRLLAERGVGLWVEPGPVNSDPGELPEAERTAFLHALSSYGYGVALDQPDEVQAAVAAFQRHFRPSLINGVIDKSSAVSLRRLLLARSQNSNGFATN